QVIHAFNRLVVVDPATGKVQRGAAVNPCQHFLVFSADGRHLLGGRMNGPLTLLDAGALTVVRTFDEGQANVTAIDLSPDGEMAASAGKEKGVDGRPTVRLWDVKTGKSLRVLEGHTSTVVDVRFTRDGKRVLSCAARDEVRVWNVADGRELAPIRQK